MLLRPEELVACMEARAPRFTVGRRQRGAKATRCFGEDRRLFEAPFGVTVLEFLGWLGFSVELGEMQPQFLPVVVHTW